MAERVVERFENWHARGLGYHFDIDRARRCVLFEAEGVFSTEEMFQCIEDVVADARFESTFSHLVNLKGVTTFEPSKDEVRMRAARDVAEPTFPPGSMLAFVVGDASRRGANAYITGVVGQPFYVRMFDDVTHARCWLGLDDGGFDRATSLMIVEDHDASRSGAATLLLAEGFEVIGVANGGLAIEAFTKRPCDIVLLDHRLPDMNGTEVMEALKATNGKTKFVLVSSFAELSPKFDELSSDDLWRRYQQAGAAAYLPKPFAFDDLLTTIESLKR